MSKSTDQKGRKVIAVDVEVYQLLVEESLRRKMDPGNKWTNREKTIAHLVSQAITEKYGE